ncbi:hypothetical protein CVT24_003232 [Panaeolus cyanescens]|uniref:Uncharacterized protein n=1 Tax=Panaeolus cyanescens TaxID=181874 RepID=A0A409VFW1_9AGAR|nr:hypothetical protein CVT24_003232 [Panaeolus cyanescens]
MDRLSTDDCMTLSPVNDATLPYFDTSDIADIEDYTYLNLYEQAIESSISFEPIRTPLSSRFIHNQFL